MNSIIKTCIIIISIFFTALYYFHRKNHIKKAKKLEYIQQNT